MKKIVLMILAAGALFVAACSSSNGPEAVAEKAMSCLQKGDYEGYAATYDLSADDQKMIAGIAKEKVSKEFETKGGIKSFAVTDSQVDEEKGTAKVKVHIIFKDGSEDDQNMNLKLVDGKWKQDLNK